MDSKSPFGESGVMADGVEPFLVEACGLRGRLLRLGPLVETVLSRHAYPEAVAGRLGELLALAGLLSSMLKYEGVFSLQTRGDGPISMMVSDVTAAGELRGFAQFDRERLEALLDRAGPGTPSLPHLLGKGYLAFTVDQGVHSERYQGIVELNGATLTDCVHHYFGQSEQLATVVKLAAARVEGHWRAGAIMLQRMPREEAQAQDLTEEEAEEGWRRGCAFLGSCTEAELLDPRLAPNRLLYRLFHEDGVRVFEPRPLTLGCRCSRERVARILASIPPESLEEYKVDDAVVMTCQFCNIDYRFDETQLAEILAP